MEYWGERGLEKQKVYQKNSIFLEFLVLFAGIAGIFLLQFSIPTLFGTDGYLHIRMARFLAERGLVRTFPWTQYSVFLEQFSDKDFLFHLVLVPFTWFGDIFRGAKLASALFFAFLYVITYLFLRKWGEKRLVVLFLVVFFAAPHFLIVLSTPRPFSLVILFSILAIWLLIERKPLCLFFLTLAYAWAHISAPVMLVYLLLAEAIRFVSERRISWRNAAGVSLGLAAGFLCHPYFPNNLRVFFLNGILVPLYVARSGVLDLGGEFSSVLTKEAFIEYPFVFLGLGGMLVFFLLAGNSGRKSSLVTRVLFSCSVFYLLAGFFSRRFFAYAWPFALLFYASFLKDLVPPGRESRKAVTAVVLGSVVVLLVFLPSMIARVSFYREANETVNRHHEEFARYMRETVPPGAVIFHSAWSDSQFFIGLNPGNYYFVTLDPVYMYAMDPALYRLYRDLSMGRVPDVHDVLQNTFGVRYGYAVKNPVGSLVERIRADRRFAIEKEDEMAIFFRLKEGA